MKFLATAAMALAVATTGEAYASSFVTLDAVPVGPSRSIIVLGEPALGDPPIVLAAPDATIKTAALSENLSGSPAEAATALFGHQPGSDDEADRVAMLVPRLSRSMVLLGEPAPTATAGERAASLAGHQPTMPMVIRGGLVGKPFPAAATSAPVPAEIVVEPPPSPDTPIATERRTVSSDRPAPPGPDRKQSPEPPALPPAPPSPPPPSRQLE
ncbi:hypothetical protein GN330_16050 [Nitratireductor sp. CAU 1489]|uniref:Uncharacterized protein n=1 Tax=Nitratireductor arenosus TaxID=2682096 RepID=A0A844QLD0_9HYPH|nr:hypothetical protein [Nitratireductor arenosus]MVA98760.1 hypothetical protein [Nitratireductor arenosus]